MTSFAAPRPHHRLLHMDYMWQALLVVIVGSFMVMLDTTVVNIALPRIISVFGAQVTSVQYVLTGYMLALAIVMPATGYLTDTFGTKRVYLISMVAFTLGSALCGMSWNVTSLVTFRVLQGLGGGMLMPLGMTILFKVVPPEKRGVVMGVFGLPLMLAPVIGPTLGGYIVEYIDWRFIFTLNIPIGALGLLLGATLLRETDTRSDLKFDLRGFVLSAVGFASLLYALSQGNTDGWDSVEIISLLTIGSISLMLWVWAELTTEHPLVELRVFAIPVFALATGVTFIVTIGMFSSMFLLPIFLQDFRGLGAMQTGLLLFPQAAASGLMAPISGRLFDRFGPRPLVVTGLLLLGITTWRLSFIDVTTTGDTLREIFILRGFAMGLTVMPAMTVGMNAVPPALIARSSSLTNVLRQLFSSFGTAIFATLLTTRENFHAAVLTQTLTPSNLTVQQLMITVQRYLTEQGYSLAQAKALGTYALYGQLEMSAAVKSFDDCFYIAAGACLLGIIPAVFLKSKGLPAHGTGQGPALME